MIAPRPALNGRGLSGGRGAWVAGLAALAVPIALAPLFLRPALALGLSVAGVVAWLACRSPAYPLALAGVPAIVFGIFGDPPLPEGVVAIGLAAAVLLSIAAAVHRRDDLPPPPVVAGAPFVLTLALLCLLVLREPPAPETDYGQIKTSFFLVSNVVLLLGGIYVGWSLARLRLLLLATLVISVAGAIVVVLHVAGGGVQAILPVELTFSEGDHSISMGRQMAVGILVAGALALGHGDPSARLVAAASLPLLLTALVASGSRGPVVALLAGALALLLLGLSDRAARRRLLAIVLAAAAAIAMIGLIVPESSVVRAFSFASTDLESTSSGRTEIWPEALRIIREHPEAGIGTGGYADLDPEMIYPHNLLLEVGAELGLTAVVLVIAFLGYAAVRMARAYLRVEGDERLFVAAVAALLITAMTNAMFSFALHTNWEIWLWVGVGTALAARLLGDRPPRSAP